MRIAIVTALVAMLAATSSASAAPAIGKLTQYTTPDLIVIRDGPESRVAHLERQIAQLERALELFIGYKPVANTPLRVFMIDNHLWRYYLQPSEAFYTDFIPHRFANYLVLTEGRRPNHAGEFYFGYTQGWLANRMRGAYPLWFEEGLAALMEGVSFRSNTARFEQLDAAPFKLWFPTAQMLRIERNSPEHLSIATAYAYQWQAWVMMHLATSRDTVFADQVRAYIGAINNLETVEAAAVKSFGMSLDELDAKLRTHATLNSYPLPVIPLGKVPPVKFSPGRELSQTDALEAVADLMFAGRKPVSHLRRVVEAHEELDGGPRSRLLRLQLALAERQPPLIEAALATLEPDFPAPDIARGVGVAIHDYLAAVKPETRTDEHRARLRELAFDLLGRALTARPEDPEAAWGFAMLAAEFNRELPRARQYLGHAEKILPGNFHLAEAASLVHRASGNRSAMLLALGEAARRSRNLEQRAWALRLIDEAK
jgi:hypothetical protein